MPALANSELNRSHPGVERYASLRRQVAASSFANDRSDPASDCLPEQLH
jgi:hypothetical protein